MGNLSLGASSPDANLIGNGALVEGDVALAGSGSATVNGGAQAVGTVYRKTGGTLTLNNGGVVTGGSVQNASTDSFLNQGVMDANNASNAAFALAASAGYPTTINANSSLTLSGSGTVVLKLTDFMLSSGAALTLQGSATTTFIVNVSKKFSLSNGSRVQLAGGLLWDNVLFNVRGSGTAIVTGGSIFNGILMANSRTVTVDNSSQVLGEVIANKVKINGSGKVKRPKKVSP